MPESKLVPQIQYERPKACPVCGCAEERMLEQVNQDVDDEAAVISWMCHGCDSTWDNEYRYACTYIRRLEADDEQ